MCMAMIQAEYPMMNSKLHTLQTSIARSDKPTRLRADAE